MLILRREAEQDIKAAYEWYEGEHQNLGRAFVAEVGFILEKIEEKPELYAVIHKNVRRGLCKRFPYSVYFVSTGIDIVVIGVLHQRRNPVIWQARK